MKRYILPSIDVLSYRTLMAACLASLLLFVAQGNAQQYYQGYSQDYFQGYAQNNGYDNTCCCEQTCVNCNKAVAEFKAGYFFFTDSKMSKVYDKGGYDLQLAGSIPLWKCLQLYGSVEYLECCGKSLGDHQTTRIWEIPLSLGLKAIMPITCDLQYYVTFGPRYFFLRQHNNSDYVPKNINHDGLGGFVGTGLNYEYCGFTMDVFGEYSFKRMRFSDRSKNVTGHSVQIGGFVFGVGLGYAF